MTNIPGQSNLPNRLVSTTIFERGQEGRRKKAQESALLMKAIEICIQLFYEETFEEIKRKIELKAAIVYRIC